jgi:hypothetical protein
MAIDDLPVEGGLRGTTSASSGMDRRIKVVLIVLAVLVVGEIYSVTRIALMGRAIRAQDAKTRQEIIAQLNDQLSTRLMTFEHANQQQLEALKVELDEARDCAEGRPAAAWGPDCGRFEYEDGPE